MRSSLKRAGPLALVALIALLVIPASAFAASDDLKQSIDGTLGDTVPINTMWVVIAAVFVLLMQAGFALLEIGFVRQKNAGTIVAKILTNLSIAAICYWAVGFAFAWGSADLIDSAKLIGSNGFFLQYSGNGADSFPVMGVSNATVDAKFLFQFSFCAVSLAIVWGSTLERIKYARIRDLRDRLRVDHLPDRLALGLRWRLAPERRHAAHADRHPGLRRLDGGPPHRCDRRAGGGVAARPA